MDSATLLILVGLLSFVVERVTNAVAIILGYSRWWRERMELLPSQAPDERSKIERNRRVGLFVLGALLAIAGCYLLNLDVLAGIVTTTSPRGGLGHYFVSGLLIASGADPIRELLHLREQGHIEREQPSPIAVSGTLIVQQELTSQSRGESRQ
jgi:hypothetical protein